MMEGFGVHTFRLVNKEGVSHFVKFHWKPVAGVHSLLWDETQKIAGKNPDFNREDLWESIEKGNYPEYELGVQLLEESREFDFDFDVLDATKIWPEELIPVKKIGRMVLDRNPDNFFAETEQVAFHPGNLVPGIDVSNDPLLQGRLFSYLDTQLIRLGGPNFTEIPINRPLVDVKNNQRDGFMRQTVNKGRVNYSPNSLADGNPKLSPEDKGYVHYPQKVEGMKTRNRSESFSDHFSQATLFWNSMSATEKKHIIEAFHFELGKVETMAIRERMTGLIYKVDKDLAREVAKGIGVDIAGLSLDHAESERSPETSITRAPSLSQENLKGTSLKGRKVAVLLADGFDNNQFKQIKESLSAKGIVCMVVSKTLGEITGNDSEKVSAEKSYLTAASVLFDALLIPGGQQSVDTLKQHGFAMHMILETLKHCKPIAAAGEAVEMLSHISPNKISFSDDSKVIQDMGVVSVKVPDNLSAFNNAFIEAMAQHRFWERESLSDVIPG